MKAPRTPRPRLTSDECTELAIITHRTLREHEASAGELDTRTTEEAAKLAKDQRERAELLRATLVKLLVMAHPSERAAEVARRIVEVWDKTSDENEARDREHRERMKRLRGQL